MGSVFSKSSSSATTGYRYYFSVLAGICRGPIDQLFLIKSNGQTFWDGSGTGVETTADYYDPYPPYDLNKAAQPAGVITDNTTVTISKPDLYGGTTSEGGVDGTLSVFLGAPDQVIPDDAYLKQVMTGLRLSQFRGVVTAFFDGQVCANNPYPKAWQYRVRRVLKGWDGPVWYPEKAVIMLTDPGIPQYTRGATDTSSTVTTVYYNAAGTSLSGGESSSSGQYTEVSSTYSGATVDTYNSSGGTVTTYAVPLEYNEIYAMNPAHIIYECVTNRDWGRGMDRSLIDNVSFTDAANKLYDEGFGLCIKWSRADDVDTFVQMVIDHIGAACYTDRVSGLLCIRLIRGGYDRSALSTFDYSSGLLEVTSVETAANDAIANEVIVKYHSPVLDADKEARQQNIASINKLGCVFSVSKDYSGLPTSTLAIQVAQRDLKVYSSGWKKVQFKLDRRAYRLVPGDVIILNAPDKGLSNLAIRVATTDDSVMTDGSITIVGSQDVYSWPETPFIEQQVSTWMETNRAPQQVADYELAEATFRDIKKAGSSAPDMTDSANSKIGYIVVTASPPSVASFNFDIWTQTHYGVYSPDFLQVGPWEDAGTSAYCEMSSLVGPIGTTDTVFQITGRIGPNTVAVGDCLVICESGQAYDKQEFVRLVGVTRTTGGQVYVTVARGCVDTPAIPHVAGARVWAYDDSGLADTEQYINNDLVGFKGLSRTMLGTVNLSDTTHTGYINLYGRAWMPYPGANFRVNGYPRDATPTLNGDLTFTWSHRNRVSQADTLLGEMEGSVSVEAGVVYSIVINGSGGSVYINNVSAETATAASATLTGAGIVSGPMSVLFLTARNPTSGGVESTKIVRVNFNYDAGTAMGTPPTSGFNLNFGSNFQ